MCNKPIQLSAANPAQAFETLLAARHTQEIESVPLKPGSEEHVIKEITGFFIAKIPSMLNPVIEARLDVVELVEATLVTTLTAQVWPAKGVVLII